MSLIYFICILLINLIALTYTTQIKNVMDIPALNNNATFIRNEQELLEKINKIVIGGSEHLQIVTDYDLTLTADPVDSGKKVLNSFEMLRLCPSIPQSYKDADSALYNLYGSVETNASLTVEEKSKILLEWYNVSNNLMSGVKYPRDEIKTLAQDVVGSFRAGVNKLVSWSETNNVPIIVLSSGLGDAVVTCLEAAHLKTPHVEVIANFLDFDRNDDTIIRIKGKFIHSLNKKDAFTTETNCYEEVRGRNNIILMGDSIGDTYMADGLDNLNSITKIGFLAKRKQDSLLETYLENFDIVLVNDQTMDVINGMLNLI